MRYQRLTFKKSSVNVGLRCVFAILALCTISNVALAAQNMSWGIPSAAAHESSPLPQTPETIAQGRRIYQRCCINCHGE
jgi:mono/diheme cytochrome c family protein